MLLILQPHLLYIIIESKNMDSQNGIFSTALGEMLVQFFSAAPKLAAATTLLLVGWFLSKSVAFFLKKILAAAKIDKLGEKLNEIEFLQGSDVKISLSDILSKVVYYLMLMVFVIAATDSLGLELVSKQIEKIIDFIPRLFTGVIIFLGGAFMASLIKKAINTATKSLGISSGRILADLVFYFLLITFSITALEQAGINTDFLKDNLSIILTGAVAAFALGYGLASRDAMSNLLAGFYTRNRFKVGDEIKVGSIRGHIIELDATSVTIQAKESKFIIPIKQLSVNNVEVFTETTNQP
jgi:Mechanosensitive ion channel/Conserved TM helix